MKSCSILPSAEHLRLKFPPGGQGQGDQRKEVPRWPSLIKFVSFSARPPREVVLGDTDMREIGTWCDLLATKNVCASLIFLGHGISRLCWTPLSGCP